MLEKVRSTSLNRGPALQAMAKYPPPGVAKLAEAQREPFRSIVATLEASNFDPNAVHENMPALLAQMKSICATEDLQDHMACQLEDWVRWQRLRGYYLAYLFQLAMQQVGSPQFIRGCLLYAYAQNHLAHDLSLNSLENAYTAWNSIRALAPKDLDEDKQFAGITATLRSRLKMTYNYYRRLYSPESYTHFNPLAENLYFLAALQDLRAAFPAYHLQPDTAPAILTTVIEACAPEDVYCRVVARRILGLAHTGVDDYAAGECAFREALTQAREVNLDSEIGHLHRLLGWALMKLGRLDEAELEHTEALKQEDSVQFGYWKVLTLAELGDVRLRKAASRDLLSFDPQNPPPESAELPPELRSVSRTYVDCVRTFERAVSSLVMPVARAVEQQLMRSYADNAVQIAAIRPGNLVGAIEAFGPRYANDLVSEANVAAALDAPDYARLRLARRLVHQDLGAPTTGPDSETAFDDYLANILAHRAERRSYFEFRNKHSLDIAQPQFVDSVVKRTRALRIPQTVLMLMYLDRKRIWLLLIDASTGQPFAPILLPATADERADAHHAYEAVARSSAGSAEKARALDGLMEFYSAKFAPALTPLAMRFEGWHLKICPRYLMNQVPLHAMRVGNRRLIDICDVSYCPSLTLLLEAHQNNVPAAQRTPVMLHGAETPFYAGTIQAITGGAGAPVVNVVRRSWQDFMSSLQQHPASDIVFCCHGVFDSDKPDRSWLEINFREHVEFAQMIADLDLRGCRSVLMGACESGIGRTLVSAEYIGLPMAFLAGGVPYVIGTLWKVAQLPAAILVADYCAHLFRGKDSVIRCLNQAQRRLKTMSREQVVAWVRQFIPDQEAQVENDLKNLGDPPFADPYWWSGFYVCGDV